MRVLSLFSGIGAMELISEVFGWETVAFCEIDPFAQSILRKRFQNTPIIDDIKTITKEMFDEKDKEIDVIAGGFPCQDLSVAGKRTGLIDEAGNPTRSGLWFEMHRVVHCLRPRWVIAENVRGACNKALPQIERDLCEEGYEVRSIVIPASAFGAPHKRERLFIVGTRQDVADSYREHGNPEEDVAYSLCERLEGFSNGRTCAGWGEDGSVTERCGVGELGELWATPTVYGNYNRRGTNATSGDGLATQVKKNWATPLAEDYRRRGPNSKQKSLPDVVRYWPTPRANKVDGRSSEGYGKTLPQVVQEFTENSEWHIRYCLKCNSFTLHQHLDSDCPVCGGRGDTITYVSEQSAKDGTWVEIAKRMVLKNAHHIDIPKQIVHKGKQLWRTPDANCDRGASSAERYKKKQEANMPISLNDQIQHEVNNPTVGQLNPDWVECLMGLPIGWTNPDCDVPEPWPGWPAAMGERLWMTPKAGACGMTAKTKGRPLEMSTHLPTQTFVAGCDCVDQYPYEPPRTGVKIPNRAKRLKAIGNANPPVQYLPVVLFIHTMADVVDNSNNLETPTSEI